MKKNKNRKKIILILVMIVVLLVILLFLLWKKSGELLGKLPEENKYIDTTELERHLELNGTGVFFDKYTGELSASDVTTSLRKITTSYLPKVYNLTKDYNTSELEIFFDNNAKNLKGMIGITEKQEFVKLAQAMQKTKVNFNDWDNLEMLRETFVDESDKDGYAYAKYVVTYHNGNKVNFGVYVAKSSSADVLYTIGLVE